MAMKMSSCRSCEHCKRLLLHISKHCEMGSEKGVERDEVTRFFAEKILNIGIY